jgi:hypothetical protein
MHISFEGRLAIWLAVLGLAGAGALEVAPERAYIGFALIAVAGAMGLFLIWHHACGWLHLTWRRGLRRKMIALFGMIASGVSLIGFSGVYFWPVASPPPTTVVVSPVTPPSIASPSPQSPVTSSEPREAPSPPKRNPIVRSGTPSSIDITSNNLLKNRVATLAAELRAFGRSYYSDPKYRAPEGVSSLRGAFAAAGVYKEDFEKKYLGPSKQLKVDLLSALSQQDVGLDFPSSYSAITDYGWKLDMGFALSISPNDLDGIADYLMLLAGKLPGK